MLRSFDEIKEALRKGTLTLPVLVEHYLERIERNKSLNMYVEVWGEEAVARAIQLQKKYEENQSAVGSLFGMVLSIKDVICYQDHGVTGGSKILSGFKSLYSSTAVFRLLEADAIIIGSTNCDEFAMGSTNETSFYGVVRNAVNPDLVPGGSSGGAAVSVQTDTCLVALGSDTGGSVRQPAAFCGINGFKPTYGRISRHGLLAYGSSFDQIGIFAHTIKDIAVTLSIIAGPDAYDSTALRSIPEVYENKLSPPHKAKIAYFKGALEHPSLNNTVRERCQAMIQKLISKGYSVEGVDFEYLDFMIPAYYVLTTAEASSNLSRYDGIRFGYRSPNATNLEETYKLSRSEGFGREVKRRILLGTFVLSSGYYDAFYGKAQQVRRLIVEKTAEIFRDYDFILMPTAPGPAWPIGQSLDDPIEMYLADIFTVHANLTGIPAISIPVKPTDQGLPLGIQFFADKEKESDLLGFVNAL
jgi:aspartyl-tRNA(Asn)/glutamyl-tRNA(Gln) amidotransferase subunit A